MTDVERYPRWLVLALCLSPAPVACTKERPPDDDIPIRPASLTAAARRTAPAPVASATTRAAAGETAQEIADERTGTMVAIPGGSFDMGSAVKRLGEDPVHRVALSPFFIDKFEVTVELYKKCVDDGRCGAGDYVIWKDIAEDEAKLWSPYCNWQKPGRERHPMNCVDYPMAEACCQWAGKRLPTEAEWEYSARGGDSRKLPWGSEKPGPRLLNACDSSCQGELVRRGRPWGMLYQDSDGFAGTAPVGSFPDGRSPFGAMDMLGNVWEWVSDWQSPTYYGRSPDRDPKGPAAGSARVYRGGGWSDYDAKYLRTTYRPAFAPGVRHAAVGFRCARDGAR
ncbi:MAG: SUMF1/EgtB/PvdO family nonheme iron enzyme [Deltaproteobacteria bacterium]|nr:SUMF1/EgtB/PvdO family nonheme iron enzyme [Deltaproteobacteria bacterium]